MVKVSLKDGIYWVGAIDWNLRDFHGYETYRGTTYNSYLIQDEKTALIDTVKSNFSEELIRHVTEIIQFEKIDYVIVNHVEMDHSSSLPLIAKLAKNARIFASTRGKEELIKHYGPEFERIETVKTGDDLKVGKKTLRFIEAPMLHWPDSMFTYVVEDKVLMPNDAFGQHLATSERFDDEVDEQDDHEDDRKAGERGGATAEFFGGRVFRFAHGVDRQGLGMGSFRRASGGWRRKSRRGRRQ